ncbi:MAG: hypothetical protein MK083_04485 [Dehalococcoidia bacterium]|nr:hypothetical protein [Dehalococcoidia bacterium]
MLRIKIILFILIIAGISFILDRLTKSKFEDNKGLRYFIFSTVMSGTIFITAFTLFYLIS